jgi:DNA uptake protein ComE-like DNA-binding protein
MIRPSNVRPALALLALLLTIPFAACSSGGENAGNANTRAGGAANANATANSSAAATNSAATNQGAAPASAGAKLNLNTASGSDFQSAIPGLGNRMVHEFEEYRPYRSIQQFRREIGKYVSPEQVTEYEKYVFVPIVPNESDAATLQQIPGLDESEAKALVAGRPYASDDAFLAKLAGSVSASELAVAKTYLGGR